jgi:hypothetical protein
VDVLEWILAAGLFALLMWVTAALLAKARRNPRKSGGGGFVIALGMIFASVFDPAKAAASEIVQKKRDTEGSEEGESGAPPG